MILNIKIKQEKKYKIYNQLYISKDGKETKDVKQRKLIESYEQEYKQDTQEKTKYFSENNIEYEVKYYDIIKIDSRYPENKIPIDTIEISKERRNILTKFELREIIEGNKVHKQNYKIYYTMNNGKESIIKEEKYGKEETKEIETIELYEIEKPMTLEIIEKKREKKLYPIKFNRIYYEEETNTKGKNKKKTRVEKVVINLEHFSNIVEKGNLEFLDEYDREVYIVNGKSIDNINECKTFNRIQTPLKKLCIRLKNWIKEKLQENGIYSKKMSIFLIFIKDIE